VRVEKLKQFSIFMPNRTGALARPDKLFLKEKIHILGIASEVRDDSGLVRIALPADADVSGVLSKAGFSSVETFILSVEVDDNPGELFRVTQALADAKINITTVYGTAVDGAKSARILVALQNADKALEVLQALAAGKA
jgi:hypothetical protein